MTKDDISTLKAEERNTHTEKRNRRTNRPDSLFGAFLFIGFGGYLLLRNLGYVGGDLNWAALFSLWPVLLIFAGVNILTQQIPGRSGSLANGLVGLGAFVFIGGVLLFADEIPFINSYTAAAVESEQITVARDGVTTADITIDFSSQPSTLSALNDSPHLLDGNVSYAGELVFKQEVSDTHAEIDLGVNSLAWWRRAQSSQEAWEIGLNPAVATDLSLDLGSGQSALDLAGLTLTGIEVDGGSGSTTLALPNGDYDAMYDVGSGSGVVTLPEQGQIDLEIDGGSGAIKIIIPQGMQAHIEIDGGSGSWRPDDNRLEQISQDGNDSVWQTADYTEGGANRLNLTLDIGSGSVSFVSN